MSQKVKQFDELDRHMQEHLTALKVHNVDEYFKWCVKNGFKRTLNKGWQQCATERLVPAREKADSVLAKHRQNRRPENVILDLLDNWHLGLKNETPIKRKVYDILTKMETFYVKDMIRYLLPLVNLFEDLDSRHHQMIDVVANLAKYQHKFVRPLTEWKPRSHNLYRQFNSLLKHLFVKYEMPNFMNQVWFENDACAHGWFIHLGTGKNIRTADHFPVALTKKQAHYFYQAPDKYNVISAVRYGEILALGGKARLADALLPTRLCQNYQIEEFWQSVVKWFIDNPMLDLSHVGPIIDWIYNQKYTPQQQIVNGVAHFTPPPQPGLSMHHRDVWSTLKSLAVWHKELGESKKSGNLQWHSCGISGFSLREGQDKNLKVWSIRELLSGRELIEEGKKLHHCVSSYSHSCSNGNKAIYSMTCESMGLKLNKLTMEVDLGKREIVQARGEYNVKAGQQESRIMGLWSAKSRLSVMV